MNVLVVSAHPDDEILGCGATMARLIKKGHRVSVVILGEGSTARAARRADANQRQVLQLEKSAVQANRILGIKTVTCHRLPDNRFDAVPLLDIIKLVERAVQLSRAEAVYTHHAGDLNIDHTITHRAVLTATRPGPGHRVKTVYAFEIPSSTEWAFGQLHAAFNPTVFVDVAATLAAKRRALEAYRRELRPFPHPRSLKAVTSMAQRWGSVVGVAAAEAFELIRMVQ